MSKNARCYFDSRNAGHDKVCSNNCFRLSYVLGSASYTLVTTGFRRYDNSPEEELSVQITNVDRVHVDDMNVLEPRQGEVGEDLTSQTTCADNKDFALVPKKVFDLFQREV